MKILNLDISKFKGMELATFKISDQLFFSFHWDYRIDLCFGRYEPQHKTRRLIASLTLDNPDEIRKPMVRDFYSNSNFNIHFINLFKQDGIYFLETYIKHKKIMGHEIIFEGPTFSYLDYKLYLKLMKGEKPTTQDKEIK